MRKLTIIIVGVLCAVLLCSCLRTQGSSTPPEITDSALPSQIIPETTSASPEGIESSPTETLAPSLSEFGFDDWGMLGIRLGDSIETVLSVLGEPESQETHFSPSAEENETTCKYDFGYISLLSHGVDDIYIENPGFPGCRGIQVGDDVQSVLDKFPGVMTGEPDISGRSYIYGDAGSNNNAFLSIDILGNSNITTISFLCGERDGVRVAPVALRVDVENDHVSAIRLFVTAD